MIDQLRLLLQLQEIDSRVHKLEATMAALPKPLEADKQTLDRLEQMLAEEKARFAETEAWRRDQEHTLALEDEAIKKAKAKLQASKTPKDYTMASREVDNKRKAKSDREEEILKVMEALEKARAEIDAREKDVAKLRERVAAEEAQIAAQIAEIRAEAEERSEGRDDIVPQIEERVYKRYERTRKQRGSAVSPIRDGVCQGCHMAVPPQLDIVVARGESIETCPRCQRILYREEHLAEAEAGDDGEATA